MVMLGSPFLYLASFGPACWLWEKEWIADPAMFLYSRPLAFLWPTLPEPVHEMLFSWFTLGGIACSDIRLFFLLH
jgi:hypothetical protein